MKTVIRSLGAAFLGAMLIAAPMGATGCAQLAALTKNEQVATYDEKAQISVEALFGFVLDQTKAAADAGVLNADQAKTVAGLLIDAKAAVDKARALYDKGQAVEASPETAAAFDAVNKVIAALVAAGAIKQ